MTARISLFEDAMGVPLHLRADFHLFKDATAADRTSAEAFTGWKHCAIARMRELRRGPGDTSHWPDR